MDISKYTKGLAHIGIPTNKYSETIQFYTSIGFKITMSTINENNLAHVSFLNLDNLILEVYEEPSNNPQLGAIDHIAINVKNICELYDDMSKEKYYFFDEKVKYLNFWDNGVGFFTIKGPNEEKIEFCEILGKKGDSYV